MNNKKLIIIKISGGALSGKSNKTFNKDSLQNVVSQIKTISEMCSTGLVVGGGNIWRGAECDWINPSNSHYVGMLSTVVNGLVLADMLKLEGCSVEIFGAFEIGGLVKKHSYNDALKAFEEGKIVVFVGGLGVPYVSTDMNVVLKAIEFQANLILVGKNSVEGVYDKDPNLFHDAKKFDAVSYDEIIKLGISVMDPASFQLAKEHNIQIRLFDQCKEHAFIHSLEGKGPFTTIT